MATRGAAPVIDVEKRRRAVDLAREGFEVRQIAASVKLTTREVRRVLHGAGLMNPDASRICTPPPEAKAPVVEAMVVRDINVPGLAASAAPLAASSQREAWTRQCRLHLADLIRAHGADRLTLDARSGEFA